MKRMRHAKWIVVCLIMVLSFGLSVGSAYGQDKLVFGVHPFKSAKELNKMFTPLIKYLEKETGQKIQFRSSRSYDAAIKAILDGKVDISYLGPAGYAILSDEHPTKVRPIAVVVNKGKPTFKGVIVTKDDSRIKSLKQLRGKKVAFGDRKSTLSCYMPAYMIMKAGVFDSISYNFLGTHDNVAKAVQAGFFDAGGLKPGVANKYIGKGLKVLAVSQEVHEHVIVAGSRLNPAMYKKIRRAILNVKDPKVYKSIKKSLTGFASVRSRDYNNLRTVIKAVDAKIPTGYASK